MGPPRLAGRHARFGVAVVDRWLVIPFAVLAGLAVDAALEQPRRLPSVALLAVAGITAVTGVLLAPPNESLTADERETMAWASSETPPESDLRRHRLSG